MEYNRIDFMVIVTCTTKLKLKGLRGTKISNDVNLKKKYE